jgi:hypothetical protein
MDLDEVHFADLFRDVLQFGIWLFSFQFGPSLSIFKLPHCDCKDLHAESKLCVEGLNIVVREREKRKKNKKRKDKDETAFVRYYPETEDEGRGTQVEDEEY